MTTPLGFILSLLGVIQNKDRLAGILGLVIVAALAVVALLFAFG